MGRRDLDVADIHTEFFVARGRSLAVIRTHYLELEAYQKAFWDIAQSIGAAEVYYRNHRAFGFGFQGAAPEGVRPHARGSDVYVPALKTNAGKDLWSRMDKLPKCPGSITPKLYERGELMGDGFVVGYAGGGGFITSGVAVRKAGEDFLIEVPIPKGELAARVPFDAERIKRSEYWARIEAAEEAAKAAVPSEEAS